MNKHHGCPVQAAINAISGKWKVQMIWKLSFGPLRFAELRDRLDGISEKVLIEQLKDLVRDGIVSRSAGDEVPPKVIYSLTPAGEALLPTMKRLCEWGAEQFHIVPTLVK